ncbi:hypothetical protein WH47_03517, partial [Habropoda laboriosa]
ESKKGCCAHTFPTTSNSIGNQPQDSRYQTAIRSPTETCNVRKCKYAKSQAHHEFCSTQRLLDKIQYLKKNIQDLETSQRQFRERGTEKKDVPSQTIDCRLPDLSNVRGIVNNCITEMTKLKEFLDDENCWWKMFKKREFNCCEQKLPHLHGFLDGTMVTLKMLEETLEPGRNPATSTPTKSNSLTYFGSNKPSDQKKKYGEQYTDNIENYPKRFVDSAISPGQSIEFAKKTMDESCQDRCPMSCAIGKHSTPIPGTSKPPDLEKSVKISEIPSISEALNLDSFATISKHEWMSRSSVDLRQGTRPSYTFSGENMARKHIIAADIGTSMDLQPVEL